MVAAQAECWNENVGKTIGQIDPDKPDKDQDAYVTIFPLDGTFRPSHRT